MKIGNFSAKTYLDFNATTPPSAEILSELASVLQLAGNPSSIHWAGQGAKTLVREARAHLAKALGVSPLELVFTSGGSESNNTVLQSFFEKTRDEERCEFITTTIEHPSVLKTLQHLQDRGAVVHFVGVNRQGQLDWDHFHRVLSPRTALVSMMLANNETGLLLPVAEVTRLAHQMGALVHTDAVQALGKIPLELSELGVDFASFSAHKFYALKGCGVLYCKKGQELRPLIFGGGQERHRRGGTENTLGIWALGKMASLSAQIPERARKLQELRDDLEKRLQQQIPGLQVNHADKARLPNTCSVVIPEVDGETLLMSLDVKGYAVSTGAACSSGSPEPSPVLLALGLSRQEAQSSLRLSLGWTSTQEEIDAFLEVLSATVWRLRSLSSSSQEVSL